MAGDVFEHNQLAPRDVSQSLEAMRAIGIPVYLLPGNHDPLDASSVYTSALFIAECPENVTVLDRAGVHEVRPGLQIVAAPWRSKAPTSDLVGDVLDGLPADGVTRIVVGHGGVDILDPDPDKPSLIRLAALEAAIARGAVHYVALGDKHSRTEVGSHRPGVVLRARRKSPTTTTSSPIRVTCWSSTSTRTIRSGRCGSMRDGSAVGGS